MRRVFAVLGSAGFLVLAPRFIAGVVTMLEPPLRIVGTRTGVPETGVLGNSSCLVAQRLPIIAATSA
jgi:hypothetical protein